MTHCTDRIIANKFMYPWKFRSVLFFSPPISGNKILDSCLSLTLAHFYDTLQMHAYTKSVLNRFSFSLFFPFFLQPIVYIPLLITIPHPTRKKFLDPCLSQYWYTVRTTLYKALTDWLLESRIHTLFIQQLPVDDIWPKKHRV